MLQLKKGNRLDLAVDQILVNPDQPRKVFDEEELEELSSSIGEFGVIQPLIVKKDSSGKYFLIAGERRLRAAIMAGLTKVPVIVREADEKDVALIAIIENVQREDLNYMEEALAYRRLMDEFQLTQADIAKKVPHAREVDDAMADARRTFDWEKQWECSIDPETAKAIRDSRAPEHEDSCSMCGKFCAVRSMNKALNGEYIDIL